MKEPNYTKESAVVVLSGGQDSTTCLFWALERFGTVHAITFNYGQRHMIELKAASDVWKIATGVKYGGTTGEHHIVDVRGLLRSASPLMTDRPLAQFDDAAALPTDGRIEDTFVPVRNQFFLTVAANFAIAKGARHVVTGVCQEDSGGYPDCRQSFIRKLEDATAAGLDASFYIHTPLMFLTKAEAVELAYNSPAAYIALAFSHTAYDGQYPPTGKDHASVLRAKGFEEADLPDPLVLRAVMESLMALPKTRNYRRMALNHSLVKMIVKARP